MRLALKPNAFCVAPETFDSTAPMIPNRSKIAAAFFDIFCTFPLTAGLCRLHCGNRRRLHTRS
jgi:hypothetical protein